MWTLGGASIIRGLSYGYVGFATFSYVTLTFHGLSEKTGDDRNASAATGSGSACGRYLKLVAGSGCDCLTHTALENRFAVADQHVSRPLSHKEVYLTKA
jgi:hypothetical protein